MKIDQSQQPASQKILEDLQSNDPDVIRSAAFSAGDAKLADAVELLCKHVQSSNIGVQEAAEYALRAIRGTRTILAIMPLLRSDDAPIRNIAMDVLREIGSDDIAAIQPLLRDADPDMRIFMADILGCTNSPQAVPLLCDALLKDPEVNVRYQAAVSLGALAYPEAVNSLAQAMNDEEWVQFSVVEALTKIRADSTINALVQSLSKSSELVSSIIIDALGTMGNTKAVPLLFKTLDMASVPLRHKTVKAIVQILGGRSLSLLSAKDQERFRAYLLEALTDEDEDIQRAALSGLAVMGDEKATSVIVELGAAIDPDRNHDFYKAAVEAVAAIGFNESLKTVLNSKKWLQVRFAMEAIALMDDYNCVAPLEAVYPSLDRDLQRMASQQLSRLGQEADIPFFMSILEKTDDSDTLRNVIYFLGMRMHCTEAQDAIFMLLNHPYDDVKEAALQACLAIHSPELNARFKELVHSEDSMQRMMAIYAIARFGLDENLNVLTDALEDESPSVRQLAVESFGQPDCQIAKYLKYLLPRLHDEAKEVRAAVVELLGQAGGEEVLPHLYDALKDDDEWVRIRAVEALGATKNTDAAPELVKILEDASPMLTFKVIAILGKLGGNVAFRALLSLMDHEDPEIQHAAAEAVEQIKSGQE